MQASQAMPNRGRGGGLIIEGVTEDTTFSFQLNFNLLACGSSTLYMSFFYYEEYVPFLIIFTSYKIAYKIATVLLGSAVGSESSKTKKDGIIEYLKPYAYLNWNLFEHGN